MSYDLVKRLRSGNVNHIDADIWMSEASYRIEALEAALAKADDLADAHDANRPIEDIDVALQAYREARNK